MSKKRKPKKGKSVTIKSNADKTVPIGKVKKGVSMAKKGSSRPIVSNGDVEFTDFFKKGTGYANAVKKDGDYVGVDIDGVSANLGGSHGAKGAKGGGNPFSGKKK